MRSFRPIVVFALLAAAAAPAPDAGLRAQEGAPTATATVRGSVRRADGRPVPNATVFVLETLEEARADSAGRFLLRTTHRGLATIVARQPGFEPRALDVVVPVDSLLEFVLAPMPPVLGAVTVLAAGEYRMDNGTTATLTPLEVAQMPGAAANVARAVQTLPGVQAVDEGTGLFVRGGDVTETRVLIDDATFLSPARFLNPTGHVTSTVDPFLLSRTVFSAGGFGAEYGNALSGLIRMVPAGRPERTTGTVTMSIGSVVAAGAIALHPRFGVRGAARRTSLAPLMAAFGAAQPFDPAPRGGDASLSAEWRTGAAGRVRLFALRQDQEFGVGLADATTGGRYRGDTDEHLAVLSWRDSSRAVRPAVTIGRSGFDRAERIGALALDTRLRNAQVAASMGWHAGHGTWLRMGAEIERLDARYTGRRDDRAGAPAFDEAPRLVRRSGWGEATVEPAGAWRLTAGVRADHASLSRAVTVDPRLGVAWERGRLAVTGALGRYHQVAEPVFFRPSTVGERFRPMRVDQAILGVQWGGDTLGLRAEAYAKRSAGLWQFTRDFGVAGDGRGSAHGADLLFRWQPFPTVRTRVTWSVIRARRTDPDAGVQAPAPSDITHSITWVVQRQVGGLTIGTALRAATGRPFTDVVGTAPQGDGVAPVWGPPNGARLPAYRREDLSVSWYRGLGEGRGLVLWGSASNLWNRANVMRYRWTDDFTERLPVRAPFNRSVYVGATLLF